MSLGRKRRNERAAWRAIRWRITKKFIASLNGNEILV
jgi:hypothetical protein